MTTKQAKATPSARSYPLPDVKLLYGLSAGRCNEPKCFKEVLVAATKFDKAAVVGKIAHIEAHSDNGPRANPKLTKKQRDSYGNWILLCGLHHDTVDSQSSTFTIDTLRGWKRDHENRVREGLAAVMPAITYAEFEVITKGITAAYDAVPTGDLHVIAPAEKMKKNGLTNSVRPFLHLALGKAPDVKHFVQQFSTVDPGFPERLKAGLLKEYTRLHSSGYKGDSLFEALMWFSAGGHLTDMRQLAAGLAVLGYFFMICEVFEK